MHTAFVIEAGANLFGAIGMLAFPEPILRISSPATLNGSSPLSKSLLQWLAALVIGLTPQLLLALPETRRAVGSRYTVYITLLAGEAALLAVMAWQGFTGGSEQNIGLTKNALLASGATLGITAIWRMYAMSAYSQWFEEESGKEE